MSVSQRLPDFPWDTIGEQRELARAHPGGLIDMSVGSPVDPTPQVAVDALTAAAQSPGYPTTQGIAAIGTAVTDWLQRRFGVTGIDPAAEVLPLIGSKEFIMLLPTLLGLADDDTVVIPEVAYPTYAAGGLLAGCTVLACGDPSQVPEGTALAYINSPSNPTGAVLDAGRMRAWVDWARSTGALLASDECYLEFGWEPPEPVSVLDPRVSAGSTERLMSIHSLSKRSNLAGYRAAFAVGDSAVVTEVLGVRKHAGLMMPGPIQHVMAATLADDSHVDEQRDRYARRRAAVLPALERSGWQIDDSEAGLYLWARRPGHDCDDSLTELARLGVLAAPGRFYTEGRCEYVRIAMTVSDGQAAEAAARLDGRETGGGSA